MDDEIIREEVARSLKKESCILEVGCGDCSLVRFLSQEGGHRVFGIDLADKWAGQNTDGEVEIEDPDYWCKKVDAEHMTEFRDNQFDAVVAVRTLHELSNPNAVLLEIMRILRKGGKIVIADFLKGHEGESLWNEKFYSTDEIGSMLGQSGFSGIHMREPTKEPFVFAVGEKRA